MAVAVWCWHDARMRAFTSRLAACKAAQAGNGAEAMRFTADARRHDQIAEAWRAHIPAIQWVHYWDYQRHAQQQHAT